MTIDKLGLMVALDAKMGYLNHRQTVISQNIANADTPGYRPQDLSDLDFGSVLDKVGAEKKMSVRMGATNEMHMPAPSSVPGGDAKEQRKGLYEVAPSGNAVVLEQQLIKSNETMIDYNLMTGIYKKQISMMKTALSKG